MTQFHTINVHDLAAQSWIGASEDQIERHAEWLTDVADRAFMGGKLTQAEYDDRMHEITRWVDARLTAARL